MEIKELSIADIKSAYDFVLINLEELRERAKKDNIPVETIPIYKEVKSLEAKLWDELLNRTHSLQ